MRSQDTGLAGGGSKARGGTPRAAGGRWHEAEMVDSSVLTAMAYDGERRELTLHFKESGERYRYLEVPLVVWRGLQAAESKGTFLNQVLKPMGFAYRRVGRHKG